ncbi:MAG: hypothetical protein R2857_05090 [Vampirovibrionales bacterium]
MPVQNVQQIPLPVAAMRKPVQQRFVLFGQVCRFGPNAPANSVNVLDEFFRYTPAHHNPDTLPTCRVHADQLRQLRQAIKTYCRQEAQRQGPLIPTRAAQIDTAHALAEQCIDHPPAFAMDTVYKAAMEDKTDTWRPSGQMVQNAFLGPAPTLDLGKDQTYVRQALAGLMAEVNRTAPDSPAFVSLLERFNRLLANGVECEMNVDRINELAQSDEAIIFVASHRAPPSDVIRSFGFLTALYKAYQDRGATSAPRPKYFFAERALQALPNDLTKALTQLEFVQVDATPYPSKARSANNQHVGTLLDGFVANQNHLIIYPEGSRNIYHETRDADPLNLFERFQDGTAKLILKALEQKGRVKVVTLGFDPAKSLYVGKPMVFTQSGNQIEVEGGNFDRRDLSAYPDHPFLEQLASGKQPLAYGNGPLSPASESPVAQRQHKKLLNRLITGVLATDLQICDRLADEAFAQSPLSAA